MSNVRVSLQSFLSVLLVLSGAFMSWKALSIATNSPFPIMVVISESMSPAFHRGDVIFLWNREPVIKAGDIPVIWFPSQPLPMVHRAVQVNSVVETDENNVVSYRQKILTKGDNNPADDVVLYPPGQSFANREEIVGVVRGYIPSLGWITIVFSDYPWLKAVLLGGLGLFTMLGGG